MRTTVVVHRLADWPVQIPGVSVVMAAEYLTDLAWIRERAIRVVNLCRSYAYQSEGYYVSLLAAARRHRPFPDLRTVLDMKSRHLVRTVDEELDALIQKSLADIQTSTFELSVYFGQNLARRHARLAHRLFTQFPAPLQRATFVRNDRWRMTRIGPIGFRDVPTSHREFVADAAAEYVGRRRATARARRRTVYDLAILHNPDEPLPPSNPRALARFRRAAQQQGCAVEMIQRDDYNRLGEFDALLVRETTYVDHHTFRFAQRAEAEGLVVIDDPTSILRCTNKVYQAELLTLHRIPTPRTVVMSTADADLVETNIGYPCVLKYPDSSFSQGVIKCDDGDAFRREAARVLAESSLLVVQEFLPTDFDWRIGVFANQPLFGIRYLMARGHWQVIKKTTSGRFRYGRSEPVPLAEVPRRVLTLAVRAARLIGDGLYGVDIKVASRRTVVTEINDNPNIDAGSEDAGLGDELYRRIIRGMLDRVEINRRRQHR